MTTQIVKDFNSLLEALIQQITPLTNGSYHLLFKNLVKMNALLPIKTFNEYALQWKDHILQRDEKFFLREDVIKGATDDSDAINQIFQLQDVWKHLDQNSKDNLWEMTQALLQLGEEYYKIKG